MGYLLPVHYTQYQEYQNRIKPIKDSRTIKVDRVKRIFLSEKNELVAYRTKNKDAGNKADKVYANVTGIGGNFDARA